MAERELKKLEAAAKEAQRELKELEATATEAQPPVPTKKVQFDETTL